MSLSIFMVLAGTLWSYGQSTYYSKPAATDFNAVGSWGLNTDGSGAAPGSVSTADNFVVQNGSAMSISGNVGVRSLVINAGSLTISANTLTVEVPGLNNSSVIVGLAGPGTLTVSGTGALNVNGRLEIVATNGTLVQSGGNITLDGNAAGVAGNSVAGAAICNILSSNLTLTGGTLTIVDPHAASGGVAFNYNAGTAYNSPFGGHTVRFGNGVSTDAGGDATNGFRTSTWTGAGRFLFGNLTIDLVSAAGNRFVTHAWSHGINGNLLVTSGEFRTSPAGTSVAGNVTNNGTLTTLATLSLQTFIGGTPGTVSSGQTITGTGVFRNLTAAPTANFTSLSLQNNSAAGVTFANANSLLSGGLTGTVSGTFTCNSRVSTGANVFVLGFSTATVGTLAYTSGGFVAGSSFRRWSTTLTFPTSLSSTVPVFPLVTSTGLERHVYLSRSAALGTGGWIQASHTDGAGLTPDVFTDGAYNVQLRSQGSWSFTSGGGIGLGAATLSVGARGDGILALLAAPGTAPRFVQAGAALGSHVAGAGSSASPVANRSGFSLANLTGSAHYIGVNSGDLPIFSVTTGAWDNPATWSSNPVLPTSTDVVLVSAGTTVTVNAAAADAGILTVQGTLNITGNALTVPGTLAGNGLTIAGGGAVNVSAGTLNVGIAGNVTNNRTLLVANGGTLNASSTGTVNVFGNLNFAQGSTFAQSGGNIVVDGNAGGNAVNSVASGVSIVNISTNNVSGVTGGTLTIVDPHANTTTSLAFGFNMPAGFNCAFGTGHTLRYGNGVSTDPGGSASGGFRVDHWVNASRIIFGNVQISTGSGTNRVVTNPFASQTVGGNLTIDAGSEWSAASIRLGGNVTNNGTLTVTTELAFCTSELGAFLQAPTPNAQTIGGSGVYRNAVVATANAPQLLIGNSSVGGVTFNIPFTQRGLFLAAQGRINTTTTNVLTHIKTIVGTSVGTSASFPGQAAYVVGPFRVNFDGAYGNAGVNFPVGLASGPSWVAMFNTSTTAAGLVIQIQKNGSIAAPNAVDPSLTGLVPGHEWETSIVSGGANLTSFMFQLWSSAISVGNVIAGFNSAVNPTEFTVFGTGSNVIPAGAPLFNVMPQNNPVSPAADFPQRLAIGTTGPLNVASVTMAQSTVPAVLPAAVRSSTNNNLARVIVSAVGSSGTVALNTAKFTYTGTAPAIDITQAQLWAGSFSAPTALITGASAVISAGEIEFTGISHPITSGVNYLWLRFDVSGSASLGNTVDVNIQPGDFGDGGAGWTFTGGATASIVPAAVQDPAGNVTIDYCLPTYATGCSAGDDAITNVTLVGSTVTINQNSGCPLTPFYTRYTSPIADLQQGSGYTVAVTMGADATQNARVWIDFDQDGVLAAGESFTAAAVGANGTANIAITVPGTAVLGNTRMRVRGGDDVAIPNTAACGASSSSFGEGEDYTVEITSPTPFSITSITATQQTGGIGIATNNNNLLRVEINTAGSLGTLTLTQARFTYTGMNAADIAALGVSLWTGTSTAPNTQIGTSLTISGGLVNFTGLSTALTAGTNYLWLRVNSSASAVIGRTVDANIAIGDFTIVEALGAIPPGTQPAALVNPPGNRFIDYCAPTYSSGCSGGDQITNVTLNGQTLNLNNTSACAATPFYTYYDALTKPDLFQGGTYPISISFGGDVTQWSRVWIDFDNDGQLEASESFAPSTSAGGSGTSIFNIVVPSGATLGDLRMRVRGGDDAAITAAQACGASGSVFGESEDYIVTIIPPPNCSTALPLAANTTTASVTSACSGNSVSFNLVGALPLVGGFTYQLRRNGTNVGAPVANLPIVAALTLGGNYDIQVLCNAAPALTAAAVAITVLNPTVTSATGATRCGPGTLNMVGVGSAGTTMRWYTTPTGGVSVNQGPTPNTYTTPSLLAPSTTTYYVEATQVVGTISGGPSSPAIGAFAGTINNFMQFDVASNVTIVSADFYPTTSGATVFELRNSSNVLLATANYNFTPAEANSTTSAIGTPVTVPLGFNVTPGTGYRIVLASGAACLRNSTNAAPFYGVNYNGLTFTGNGFGNNNFWYQFYNLQIEANCTSPRSSAIATVTTPQAISIFAPVTNICDGVSVGATASSTNGAYVYTWSGGPFSPAGNGATKTLTPTTTTTYTVSAVGGGCNNVNSVTITVRPTPTNPTASQVPVGGLCVGGTKTLNSTASTTGNVVLLSENFNGGTLASLGWSVFNNVTPVAPINDWFLQSTPYTYGSPQITNFSITSPASPFVVVNSDAMGTGSSGTSSLVSPSFSTVGRTSGTISFNYVYRFFSGDFGRVDYTTDGGATWFPTTFTVNATTPAQTWTPTNIQTTTANIAMPAGMLGEANVRIRFFYNCSFDYYWMLDNLVIEANDFVSYRWSSTSPFAGIPVAAQAYSPLNTSVVVQPTEGGVMPYTVEVTNSSGCTSVLNGTTSFNVSDVEVTTSNSGPQRVGTTLLLSGAVTGTFGALTYEWRKTSGVGSGPTILNTSPSYTYPGAVENNSGTYQLTVIDGNGCSGNNSTDAIVYEALVWNGSVNNDWSTAANWTPSLVPKTPVACTTDPLLIDNIVITNSGTAPTYPGLGTFVNNFAVESGQLTINNNIFVCGSLGGAFTGVGKVVGAGTIELVGSGTNFVGGLLELDRLIINKTGAGPVNFQGKLTINDLVNVVAAPGGLNVAASGQVILKSTLTQTARIGVIPPATPIAVTAPGGFVQQRRVPFTVPASGNRGNWFFMGSAISGKLFTDWSDNFRMAGTTGSFSTQGGPGTGMVTYGNPRHTTAFKYVEAQRAGRLDTAQKRGWRIPTGAETIGTGVGYRVFVQRYGMKTPDNFDNTGLIHFGNVTLPQLSSTEVTPCNNNTDGLWCFTADRGYNLVANPYPHDIDWEAAPAAWNKPTELANFYTRWVNNPGGSGYGQYTTGGAWTGIVPQPANPRYIPSSQAFWVRLDPTGASYTRNWSITEAAKSVPSGTFVRTATENSQLTIQLTKPELDGLYGFQSVVRFSENGTEGFRNSEDVTAMAGERFSFSMPVDNQNVVLNNLPVVSGTRIVPINVSYLGETGSYVFKFNDVQTLAIGTEAYLHDKFLNTMVDLRATDNYQFVVSTDAASRDRARFELIFAAEAVTSTGLASRSSGLVVYPNPTEVGSQTKFLLSGFGGTKARIVVADASGKVVLEDYATLSANGLVSEYEFKQEVPSGVYSVRVTGAEKAISTKFVVK